MRAPQRRDLIRQSLDFLVLHARVPEQLRASALRLSSVRERHVGGLLASSTLLPNLTVHDNDRLLQERTKGFLVVVDGKDLCLGDDQRTAGADDLASGDQPLSVGRRNEIQFVLDGQNRGAGWHHCHRRVAGGRIGNGPDDATMHKAMLLLNALPVGKMDFGAPVLNDGQRSLIRCITFCRSKLSRKRSAKCGSEKQGSRRVAGSLRCRGCCQVLKPRGRPKSGRARTLISLRLPPETLARWRATGPGWQTRMAEALSRVRLTVE